MFNRLIVNLIGFFKFAFHLDNYLGLIEKLLLRLGWRSDRPQVFIMGLPRSGTTLIYQYIVHRLQVAYFTNGVGSYPKSPCLISKIQRLCSSQYISNFESNYGKVSGTVAPREAGAVWGRFFSLEDYINFSDINRKKANNLKLTVNCMQAIFGNVAFVNKNVKHLLRIDALSKIFPKSVFLIVERDVRDVALSLLRGRYRNVSNLKQWWSVRPEKYQELLELDPCQQIAWQVILLKERMERDLALLPQDRVVRISYDDFCSNPEQLIRRLASILDASETNNSAVLSFPCRKNSAQSSEEESLWNVLQDLEKKNSVS